MTLQQAAVDRLTRWFSPGDVDWETVYKDQLPRIYNYFRFRLGSDADVEDLTARTFEKAWRARKLYRRDLAGFSTWLYKIAQNVSVDYLRTRRSYLPIEAAMDVVVEDTPETKVEHASNLARLAKLTAALPERERDLIALKYGAAITNREIAQLTGLSESNVGTLLHRLMQTLRSQWPSREIF